MIWVLALLAGLVLTVGGIVATVAGPTVPVDGPVAIATGATLLLVAALGTFVKLVRSPSDGTPLPWTETGELYDLAPERTPSDESLSGEWLAGVVADAGEEARSAGDVDDGLAVVREPLRDAVVDVLVQSGYDTSEAREAVTTGEWTDDRTAAAVVEGDVRFPPWRLRRRLRAWLAPEAVVRELVRETVNEIDALAGDVLPEVPGRRAPRSVPVTRPTLEDLRRGADGRLQRAVDPPGARSVGRGASDEAVTSFDDEPTPEHDETEPADGERAAESFEGLVTEEADDAWASPRAEEGNR